MALYAKCFLAASACVIVSSFAPPSVPRSLSSLLLGSRESVFDDVALPDFDSVFGKIQQLSPLARSIINTESSVTTDGKCKICSDCLVFRLRHAR